MFLFLVTVEVVAETEEDLSHISLKFKKAFIVCMYCMIHCKSIRLRFLTVFFCT